MKKTATVKVIRIRTACVAVNVPHWDFYVETKAGPSKSTRNAVIWLAQKGFLVRPRRGWYRLAEPQEPKPQ